MALLVPNEGEVVMVQAILDLDLDLHLFKNDHTPAETDTVADYTEADFTGYVLENLISGNWVITPGAPAVGNYPTLCLPPLLARVSLSMVITSLSV
jgi:hypothetical protein